MPNMTTKTTKQVLIEARDLISDPARWCQGSGAVDAFGASVPSYSSSAVAWCAVGAVAHACPDPFDAFFWSAIRALEGVVGKDRRIGRDFNDAFTHAEVLDAFDRAIASCE